VRDIDSAPAFSPDGQRIVYVRGILDPPGNDILMASTDGSGERVLAERRGFGPGACSISWSEDGQTLALISPETRNGVNQWILETISASTGEVRDLHAFPVPTRAVAWLPDGNGLFVASLEQPDLGQIRFVSYPSGEVSRFTNDLSNYDICCLEVTRDGRSLVALLATNLSDVWIAKPDGSDARQITSGEAMGFGLAQVGDRIAASNARGQWFVMNPDGSNSSPLINDRELHLQLSACPDGKHLIYSTWRDGGKLELWASELDGSNALKLMPQSIQGVGQCTSDSKSVIYAADHAIWRVPIAGGTAEKLDLPFGLSGYSPDGKLLFYGSQKVEGGAMQSKLIVSPAAEYKAALHTFDVPFGMQSAQFTPDSQAIAFLLSRNRATNIWELPLSGSTPVQLTKFPSGEMFSFGWSRDGKLLAFSRGQRKSDVIMMSNFR
jgi:Tol biopolymer transport system component